MKRDNGLTINEAIKALNNKNSLNEANEFFWFGADDYVKPNKKIINIKDCTKLTSFEQARDLIKSLGAYWDLQEQRFFDVYKKQMNLYIYEDGENSICFGVKPNGQIHGPYDINDKEVKDVEIILFDID